MFSEVPKLVSLRLSNNLIKAVSPKTFHGAKSLRELHLDGNVVQSVGLNAFPDSLKKLNLQR